MVPKEQIKGIRYYNQGGLPPEIEQRRARLYLIWKAARNNHKSSLLVADKLYIDGNRYTVDTIHMLPAALQPSNIAKRELESVILFYGCDSHFSNFYQSKFVVDASEYSSVEQYFQFNKATRLGDEETEFDLKK